MEKVQKNGYDVSVLQTCFTSFCLCAADLFLLFLFVYCTAGYIFLFVYCRPALLVSVSELQTCFLPVSVCELQTCFTWFCFCTADLCITEPDIYRFTVALGTARVSSAGYLPPPRKKGTVDVILVTLSQRTKLTKNWIIFFDCTLYTVNIIYTLCKFYIVHYCL